MRALLILLLAFVLVSCAGGGVLNTPSGKPEVTVFASQQKAMDASAAWLMRNGYTIDRQTDYSIEGARSLSLSTVQLESFSVAPVDSFRVTIYATRTQVSHGYWGPDVYEETSQHDFNELQSELNEIAADIHRSNVASGVPER